MMIHIQKYRPRPEPLKKLIKYFWVFECDHHIHLDHKILPVNNIDIIINLNAPVTFEKDGVIYETPGNIFFSGLMNAPFTMKQKGRVLTIGVSFFPAGVFPFFKIPVAEFKNNTFGIDDILNNKGSELEERLRYIERSQDKVRFLEDFFGGLMSNALLPDKDTLRLMNRFQASGNRVRDFCCENDVHPRKLERLFHKYVGASPKRFFRVGRFLRIINRLTDKEIPSLTRLAHDSGYYDQAHFIKDFKALTGSSPSLFFQEKQSFKQIIENP